MSEYETEIKLTPAQVRAYGKLSTVQWESAYTLGCSIATLNALVRKGLVERRGDNTFGAAFFPSNFLEYRIKPPKSWNRFSE